jgi:hypothetical protein
MSRACYFVLGPKAGKTEVFPGKPAATVGGPCNDGVASRGIVAVEGAPAVGQFGLPDGQPACKDIVRAAVPYRLNEMIPKSGLATFDQSGPVIFLRGSQLPTFSPPVRTFLVAHECGHHALGQVRAALLYRLPIGPEGELAADCFAMSEMKRLNLLDAERVGVIMNFLATVPGDPTTYDGPERMRRLRQCSVP